MNKSKFPTTTVTEYTLGFVFSEDRNRVLLIQKNKPSDMAGLLNGIVGGLNNNEVPLDGMIREFKEETNLDFSDFKSFGILMGKDYKIHMFSGISNTIFEAQSVTDEKVLVVDANFIDAHRCVKNLIWLIPMAKLSLDNNLDYKIFDGN